MATPQVTVLMSVYNGLPFLDAALDSILAQTFSDFEFLIIDDASQDGSSEVLARYARADARIRVITNQPNQGMGQSLARGVQEARAPWIARMDADDVALPQRLEHQMLYLDHNPDTAVLGGWALEIDEHDQITGERRVPTDHQTIRRLIWTNPFLHPTVVFNREKILAVGSYAAYRYLDDYDLWFRCARAGYRFANLPEPLIHYRITRAQAKKRKRPGWMIAQLRAGWRGCYRVGAKPYAYLGITLPVIRALLPKRWARASAKLLRRFDPRAKVDG